MKASAVQGSSEGQASIESDEISHVTKLFSFSNNIQTMGAVDTIKSLWKDPYRWSLVKSVGMFALVIYIANELELAEAEMVVETAAQLTQK